MRYSYNLDTKGIIFAGARDINASFKDLCAVCDAIRYRSVSSALGVLDGVINSNRPIEYRRHNKYMGSRPELGGKKGRYPIKCAKIMKDVIVNASANAVNKGENPDYMYVVHAAANKTYIVPRAPSKGIRSHSGGYGYGTIRRSNLEYAKVEIGIADKEIEGLGSRMKRAIRAVNKGEKPIEEKVKQKAKPRSPAPKPPSAPQAKETKETKETKPVKEADNAMAENKAKTQEQKKEEKDKV